MRFGMLGIPAADFPLVALLLLAGPPLLFEMLKSAWHGDWGSDLLAGISIVTAGILGQYLAGALVVLMLSGGRALESYAVGHASSVLKALARRMPALAHHRTDGGLADIPLDQIRIGELLLVLPHETCPVDGTVTEGHGAMDESYLTGEPYIVSKAPGAQVLSGAINGEAALTIRAEKEAVDSRYAKIVRVMRESEQSRPRLRRLGDQLGALYTPLALAIAAAAWVLSGEEIRFLSVLVVATPCPLLIAIPVAIIGSISLSARRGIIIKDPTVLERMQSCRTAIFDKTGTLTYGKPILIEIDTTPQFNERDVLGLLATLEQYSKHPLSSAVLEAAAQRGVKPGVASEVSEPPGAGIRGIVNGQHIWVTSRKKLAETLPPGELKLPTESGGLECVVAIDGRYAGAARFRDEARRDGKPFIDHLGQRHRFRRVLLVSGDRAAEVQYLARQVGIPEVYCSQSPEQKFALVRRETELAPTLFMGDGINDAPALTAATVGIAFGQNSDITSEAAGAVILESSLKKVDEFFHISQRMRRIALQSAVGGMALSVLGMFCAAAGYLPPVAGAILQEGIDLVAVLNALRAALPPRALSDY